MFCVHNLFYITYPGISKSSIVILAVNLSVLVGERCMVVKLLGPLNITPPQVVYSLRFEATAPEKPIPEDNGEFGEGFPIRILASKI